MLTREARGDRGSVNLLFLGTGFSLLLLGGLIFDGGSELSNYRAAKQIALEAARSEAQCVDIGTYLATGVATVTSNQGSDPNIANYPASCAGALLTDITNGLPASVAPPNGTGPMFPGSSTKVTINNIAVNGNTITVQVTVSKPTLFNLGFTDSATGQATVKLATGVTDAGG